MTGFRTLPGAPVFRVPSGPRLALPSPFLFSYARHALEAWLAFEERRRGTRLGRVFLPDAMCHEVAASLTAAGRAVEWYPLGPGFAADPDGLAGRLAPHRGRAAALVCHFYGRLERGLRAVAEACRRAEVPLAEDCTHLPYPAPADAPPSEADVRIYSLRKVYGVPYGAVARLARGQEEFDAGAAAAGRTDPGGPGLAAWAARELVKRAAVAARLPIRRAYRDLSLDPLSPYSRAHPWAEGLIGAGEAGRAVRARRANYALYRAAADAFAGWAEVLPLDGPDDVPYQLLLTLPPASDPVAFISFCLERGISALAGLALDRGVLAGLAADHPYRRWAALPLHQDLGPDDVAYALEAVRAWRRERGL